MKKDLEFQKMWEGVASILDMDTSNIPALAYGTKKALGVSQKHWFYFSQRGKVSGFYEKDGMKKEREVGYKLFSNKRQFEEYTRSVKRVLNTIKKFDSEVESASLITMDDPQLRRFLQRGFDLCIDIFSYYLACQPQCVLEIEEEIETYLKKKAGERSYRNVYVLMTTPEQESVLQKEEVSWLSILTFFLKTKDFKMVEGKIKRHHTAFHLMLAADGEKPKSVQDYSIKLKNENISLREAEKRLENIKTHGLELKREKREVTKKYKISATAVRLCATLAAVGHLRLEMRANGWVPHYHFVYKILDEAARRLGVPAERLQLLTLSELDSYLQTSTLDMESLEKRREAFLGLIRNGNVEYFEGEEARRKFKELYDDTNEKVGDIHGKVAMPGKVTGRVTVYRWGDSIESCLQRMSRESVLVAGQTRPQLMPLIAKSIAIVTDEGGITSHAAIVSRELKKPCIIGTKNATHVLHDGDLVEVDADNGIVRVVKKN